MSDGPEPSRLPIAGETLVGASFPQADAAVARWKRELGAGRNTLRAAFGADLGSGDSTQGLSRVIGAGAVYQIAGPLALTLDASHGLTTASPRWVVSIGLGTAFVGTSPVSPSSPLRRLKDSFTGGVNRGHGTGKTGATACS